MAANYSLFIEGGSKVEIKNIGSFHDLEKAVHFEITRQQSLAERKIEIVQETRHWDDSRKITVSARTKFSSMSLRGSASRRPISMSISTKKNASSPLSQHAPQRETSAPSSASWYTT